MTPHKKEMSQIVSLESRQFKALIKAVTNLTKVYASGQIRKDAPTASNARFLRVFDFSEQEIADLLGITQQAVHKAISKPKRERVKTPTTGSDDLAQKT